jgi:hypothetical protein
MPDPAGTSLLLPWAVTMLGLVLGAMALAFGAFVSGKKSK